MQAQATQLKRRFFKVEEFAVITGLSRSGAYKAIAEGHIKAVRVGRRLLIPESVLENLQKEG